MILDLVIDVFGEIFILLSPTNVLHFSLGSKRCLAMVKQIQSNAKWKLKYLFSWRFRSTRKSMNDFHELLYLHFKYPDVLKEDSPTWKDDYTYLKQEISLSTTRSNVWMMFRDISQRQRVLEKFNKVPLQYKRNSWLVADTKFAESFDKFTYVFITIVWYTYDALDNETVAETTHIIPNATLIQIYEFCYPSFQVKNISSEEPTRDIHVITPETNLEKICTVVYHNVHFDRGWTLWNGSHLFHIYRHAAYRIMQLDANSSETKIGYEFPLKEGHLALRFCLFGHCITPKIFFNIYAFCLVKTYTEATPFILYCYDLAKKTLHTKVFTYVVTNFFVKAYDEVIFVVVLDGKCTRLWNFSLEQHTGQSFLTSIPYVSDLIEGNQLYSYGWFTASEFINQDRKNFFLHPFTEEKGFLSIPIAFPLVRCYQISSHRFVVWKNDSDYKIVKFPLEYNFN